MGESGANQKLGAGPIVALVVSLLTLGGGCSCFGVPVAFIMGFTYFRRGKQNGNSTMRSLGAAAMVFSVLGTGVYFARAAAGIPDMLRFQARSKQSECKKMLNDIAAAQDRYFAQNGKYASSFSALSLTAPEFQRYTYVLDPNGGSESILRRDEKSFGPLRGPVPERDVSGQEIGVFKESFVAACVGDVDSDPDVDVWTVSSADRTIGGVVVKRGQPFNDKSDVNP